MLVSLAATLAGFGWGLGLGFSLAMATLISLGILATYPKEALSLETSSSHTRAFKGTTTSTTLTVAHGKGTGLAQIDLAGVPDGLEASIGGDGPSRTLTLSSRYAGVYRGLKVRVGITDPLAIFARNEVHEIDFSCEFLPTSLLLEREPLTVPAAMLGDYPAGRSGYGQEFYSAEMYTSGRSSRDIMWKRQAKMPNENLMVRVGEANIPEKLTLCFLERKGIPERRSPRWMDLASEAIARVGLLVVSTGTTLRLLHVLGDETTVVEARDSRSLANLLVGLWSEGSPTERTEVQPGQADMVVVAEIETQAQDTMKLVLEKPSIILGWGQRKRAVTGSGVLFFSGREDISGLVAGVLSK